MAFSEPETGFEPQKASQMAVRRGTVTGLFFEETSMNETTATEATGPATGGCRTLLRLEGLTLFVGMTMLYAVWGGSWWVYAVLVLVPDVSFVAYIVSARGCVLGYNNAPNLIAPIVLISITFWLALSTKVQS